VALRPRDEEEGELICVSVSMNGMAPHSRLITVLCKVKTVQRKKVQVPRIVYTIDDDLMTSYI
jgi:hypothetical protein